MDNVYMYIKNTFLTKLYFAPYVAFSSSIIYNVILYI